jgi:hypothetical protein
MASVQIHATQHGIKHNSHTGYNNNGLDMPSQQYIHGQRQQIQNRPCTCYLGEQIAGRSIYTCPRAETVFQKAISRYAVLTPAQSNEPQNKRR